MALYAACDLTLLHSIIVQNNVISNDRSIVDIGKDLFDSGLCQVRLMTVGRSSRVAADLNVS